MIPLRCVVGLIRTNFYLFEEKKMSLDNQKLKSSHDDQLLLLLLMWPFMGDNF